MNIAIGCDHRGFQLKKAVMAYLTELGHGYTDFGCYSEESCDYPDAAFQVAKAVASGSFDQGILMCGTGIGMCIAANKVDGIRAALCYNLLTAQRARLHNNANVLCLGGDTTKVRVARQIVNAFLNTEYEGGRHQRRLDKIAQIEK